MDLKKYESIRPLAPEEVQSAIQFLTSPCDMPQRRGLQAQGQLTLGEAHHTPVLQLRRANGG